MKNSCDVVGDLLPLYVDGVCSPDSAGLVEEHLSGCPQCRALLEEMRGAQPRPCPAPDPSQDGAKVLERTARTVSLRAVQAVAGISVIILFWMVYLWQEGMADQGNYRYFSYTFHELCAVALVVAAAAVWVWLALLLWRCIRRRAWRRNWALLLVLAALAAGQQAYFYQAQGTSYTVAAQVAVVSRDGYQVEIQVGEERKTLETFPLVSNLLEADGTTYLMNYEESRAHPGQYRLNFVWDIVVNGQGEPVGK